MKSSNQELQSTNEELETANEELQSTNEELSQSNYMDKIVMDLQDHARPLRPKFAEVNFRSLIADTLSSITLPSSIQVTVEVEEGISRIRVDRDMMRRALTNLLTNAV